MNQLLIYTPIIAWLTILVIYLATKFSNNAPIRHKRYYIGSFLVIGLLLVFFNLYEFNFTEQRSDLLNIVLNLALYSISAHILILFIYVVTFPKRHWKRRGEPYGAILVSMALSSTILAVLSIELVEFLLGG
jgi:hypothetical protein